MDLQKPVRFRSCARSSGQRGVFVHQPTALSQSQRCGGISPRYARKGSDHTQPPRTLLWLLTKPSHPFLTLSSSPEPGSFLSSFDFWRSHTGICAIIHHSCFAIFHLFCAFCPPRFSKERKQWPCTKHSLPKISRPQFSAASIDVNKNFTNHFEKNIAAFKAVQSASFLTGVCAFSAQICSLFLLGNHTLPEANDK